MALELLYRSTRQHWRHNETTMIPRLKPQRCVMWRDRKSKRWRCRLICSMHEGRRNKRHEGICCWLHCAQHFQKQECLICHPPVQLLASTREDQTSQEHCQISHTVLSSRIKESWTQKAWKTSICDQKSFFYFTFCAHHLGYHEWEKMLNYVSIINIISPRSC